MKNMSIGKKLALMVGCVSFFIITVFALMAALVLQQDKQSRTYSEVDVPAMKYMKDVQIITLELRRYEKDMLLNMKSRDKLEGYEKKWSEQVSALRETTEKTLNLPIDVHAIQHIEKTPPLLVQYESGMRNVISNIKSGKISDPVAANLEIDKFKNSIRDLLVIAGETVKIVNDKADEVDRENKKALEMSKIILAIGILFGLILLAVLGGLFARQFTQPLKEATRIATLVSNGDLTQSIPVKSADEVGQLCSAFNQMIDSLKKLVSEVRNSVDHVSSASSQIVQGNLDLSSRTEQQASSLEQTAASMEEFASSMQSNSVATKEAVNYVRNASLVAQRGGEVVGQVVNTMGEIEASSKKINDIIGVIDGIAFQTNILALNAAVEAARAGEQGRGFAVVASEVRNLAQRSASAAKEIKSLIQESVSKVGEGSRLVGDAGQTMADIVNGVQAITDIMDRISNSTMEQNSGISQVNQAVGQLDQMTQQNAALVEQASAAATSLQQQASRLSTAVGFFNLDSMLLASNAGTMPTVSDAPLKSHATVSSQAALPAKPIKASVKPTASAKPTQATKPAQPSKPAQAKISTATPAAAGQSGRRETDHPQVPVAPSKPVSAKIPVPKESDEWDEF
jgi:methyl-accepting chemotaxis protein